MTDLQKKLREAAIQLQRYECECGNYGTETSKHPDGYFILAEDYVRLAPILAALEGCVGAIEAEVKRCGVWREGERALETLRKSLEEG